MDRAKPLLIAGASGLIGSACVRLFKKEGYTHLLTPTHQELDFKNASAVQTYFKQHAPEMVIFAVGKVGGILENKTYPADFITTNLTLQLNAFQAAEAAFVKKFVFFGSSCIYPRECPQPMAEEILLTGPPEPTSMAYALSKLAGLQMCHAFNTQYQHNRFVTLIPNTAYGPGSHFAPGGHVLPSLIQKLHEAKTKNMPEITLWGTGTARREFIHADDIARAVHLILKQETLPIPLNVGTGEDISIKALAHHVAQIIGYPGAITWDTTKPDGAPQKLLNSDKIKALGFKASISLEEGIRQTYQWFLEHHP